MVLKGHVTLLLLTSVRSSPSHGFAIAEELRRKSRGEFDFDDGVVYAGLHRLEKDGLLKSHWEKVDRRKCRVYELTDEGRSRLGDQRSQWRRFARAMEAILEST